MKNLSCFILILLFAFSANTLSAQSLSVTLVSTADTAGISPSDMLGLERQLELSLSTSGSSGDTLVVEVGPSAGTYDLLTRRFPLNQTGVFEDGCSLDASGGGLLVGLGRYTGLSSFYVRAYLASTGISSAITAHN